MRPPPRRAPVEPRPETVERSSVDRIAALLGIVRGPGTVVLVGEPAALATPLAARVDDLQTVAADSAVLARADHPNVSSITVGRVLPFFSWQLRGAVVDGRLGEALLWESARVISKGSRVVAVHAPEGTSEVLREVGLDVLAEEAGTVVAARS
ncbi:MAG: hypothetical protein AAF389_19520 [Gemmatimonadota bacterium]